jgi:hypothetical protein
MADLRGVGFCTFVAADCLQLPGQRLTPRAQLTRDLPHEARLSFHIID